jgi:hypothetical protein
MLLDACKYSNLIPPCPPLHCNVAILTRSEKLDVVRLTFYTAPVSLVCLAPFFWIYEVR